jgi:hypothetical protein
VRLRASACALSVLEHTVGGRATTPAAAVPTGRQVTLITGEGVTVAVLDSGIDVSTDDGTTWQQTTICGRLVGNRIDDFEL